ncbi:MAG: hypothetical protein KAJ24_07080 [Candidatus Aenigmarchaeota archaeon]|nr:hypothetical protein [Candidatus Aenigmarchaeota archaeon]
MSFFRKRKAQSATEYLMTYGWAILAITIVGALLYTQVFSQRSCATAGASGWPLTASVAPDGNEFTVNTDGTVVMALKNNFGKDITVTTVTGDLASETLGAPVVIADGATVAVTTTVNIAGAGVQGDCYTESVTVTFQTAAAVPVKSTGNLNGRY